MSSLGTCPGWDGHMVLLYDEETKRRAGVAAWVRRGLELGSKIIYTVPRDAAPHRTLTGLVGDEPDALEALDRGQIRVIPAEESAYELAFMESVVDSALAEGYPSVRWSGDASTAWEVMPRDHHESLERATDQLCRSRPLSAMCQYATPASGEDAWCLGRWHQAGLREQLFQAVPVRDGLALAGELDITNQDTLHTLLAAATTATSSDPFVLDLSRVAFLDLPGARALLLGTLDHRNRGGQVLLRSPQAHVAHLVHLLGVDQEAGVCVDGVAR